MKIVRVLSSFVLFLAFGAMSLVYSGSNLILDKGQGKKGEERQEKVQKKSNLVHARGRHPDRHRRRGEWERRRRHRRGHDRWYPYPRPYPRRPYPPVYHGSCKCDD